MRAALTITTIVASIWLGIAGPALARRIAEPGPAPSTALEYAKRSYIVVPGLGKVPFRLGTERSVTAKDGSTITAFAITSDPGGTADSFHSAVIVFRDAKFLGWASSRDEMFLTLEPSSGNAIRVLYPVWGKVTQPAARRAARSSRTAGTARDSPPLIYGKAGNLLHLAPRYEARIALRCATRRSGAAPIRLWIPRARTRRFQIWRATGPPRRSTLRSRGGNGGRRSRPVASPPCRTGTPW